MIVRDNRGKIVGELQHLRHANGNTVDSATTYYAGRPIVQLITTRDNQGRVESRTSWVASCCPDPFAVSNHSADRDSSDRARRSLALLECGAVECAAIEVS